MPNVHLPILLNEAIEGLALKKAGIYIDATFGRGGHSLKILQYLGPNGRLIALDKDLAAVDVGKQGPFCDTRFKIEHHSFAQLLAVVKEHDLVGKVDGILFDLGVSSPQLDDSSRGFSFLREGPLDMRMNMKQGMTAADWLNSAKEEEIARVLWEYGEERRSRKIAAAIVKDRKVKPFTTTTQLASMIARVNPSRDRHIHPATRSFQAIRIFINDEIEELKSALQQALEVLAIGGRLAVISFHSLEDRIVKRFIRGDDENDRYREKIRHWKRIDKLIRPSEEEVKQNPRARSARLRIGEKIA